MTYYRKMTMLIERSGIMCQCAYCKVILTPEDADNHTETGCNINTHDLMHDTESSECQACGITEGFGAEPCLA